MRLTTYAALFASLTFPVGAWQHPDITGPWTLDIAHSSFGDHPAPEQMTLNITKKGKLLRIAQTSKNPHDERTVENECKTDGNFHPVQGPVGGSIRCKWDGSTLITEKKWDDGNQELDMRLIVAPDGHSATEELHMRNTNGAGDSTLVWKRL